ncbi:hypothetical protein GSI_03568 [Ganoderma sinense ZZ0214-1]|uniref:Rab-GAP TBC domain-containing protein n=1 Tax=Ganoderma sinense ZZ0214-1 TaxID=1077348 RepID=A0A2G8SJC1_9APHY|nr:hypothetical protein GSI_03568 [Ganoderma sinense ZZ0214-1]
MPEGRLSVEADDATKPTPTSLTTTIHVPPVSTSEGSKTSSPTSPTDLLTVVATEPPVVLGGPVKHPGEDGEPSEALSSIPISPTEAATTKRAPSLNGDEPSREHAADSDNEESFGTPEATVQSLPSLELTNIPLSSADPSATAASESPDVAAASIPLSSTPADTTTVAAPQPTGVLTSPKASTQSKTSVLSSLTSQSSGVASPTDPLSASSSSSAEIVSPAPLDALLSPTDTEGKFSIRDSVAASEATEDETRFSTVLLSARQSLAPSPKVAHGLHTVDEGTGSDENTLVDDWRQHKKTASNSTILSANNVPYLLSKLSEAEEAEGEGEGEGEDETPARVRPASLQGTQAIKEEFYQRAEEEEARGQAEVDWDFWGQVINDYQGFAAANPELLAKAIERGIPNTLRGMIWQLMSASKDPELEATYLRLLKESSPHEKSIQRDLGRTFPHHAFFTDGHGIGQENLFNVLKAYSLFPMDIVFRIYDNCLASGIEAMFAFSMALLSKNETTLLSMKFDQLIQFLNQRVFEAYQIGPVVPGQAPADVRYRVDELIRDAISLRITPFMLDNYAHEYEDLVRARDAHKIEMDSLRNTNARLSTQVKTLESDFAQLNAEHCQVLNELVMARLRHEELESELVRYKLLYAEAMHQSEDAMSSHRISLVGSKRGSNSSRLG